MRETDLNQRNGDHWARTLVLKLPEMPAESRSSFEIFVLATLMASAFVIACHALGIVLRVL